MARSQSRSRGRRGIFFHEYDERVDDECVVGSVVAIKDEAEGLVGRTIYER